MKKLGLLAIAILTACSTQTPKLVPEHAATWVSKPATQRSIPESLKPEFIRYQSQVQIALAEALRSLRTPGNTSCSLTIFQLPGGQITKIDFSDCQLSASDQESVRSKLLWKALPYSGFESVFVRQLDVTVCSPKGLCDQ